MRIVFAGTPALALPSLQALVSAGHEVVGVITREDAPLGRKRVMTPSPVAVGAESLGIPVLKANRLDDASAAWVADLRADLGVIVAFGALLREPILSLPRLGWLNLHFSDLPRYRGAAPVQRALMAGEQQLGLTVFRLTEGLDDGAIVGRDSHEFPAGTSAGDALIALGEIGASTLKNAVTVLEMNPEAGEAQVGESSYAHKLTRDDGRLDLSGSADDVLAQWAGVTPEPGAWVLSDDVPLKIHEIRHVAVPDSDEAQATEGTGASHPNLAPHLTQTAATAHVTLVAGRALLHLTDGDLELLRVQPAGKPTMDAVAWLRGRGSEVELR